MEHGSGTAVDIHTWIRGAEIAVPTRTVSAACIRLARWRVLDRGQPAARGWPVYSVHAHAAEPQPVGDAVQQPGVEYAVGATIFVVIRELSQAWEVPKTFHGMRFVDVHQHVQARLQRTRHSSVIWRACRALRTNRILRSAALTSDQHAGIHSLLGVAHEHG